MLYVDGYGKLGNVMVVLELELKFVMCWEIDN